MRVVGFREYVGEELLVLTEAEVVLFRLLRKLRFVALWGFLLKLCTLNPKS